MIDWNSEQSHVLINPAYPEASQKKYNRILDHGSAWPGHIWLATSGSTVEKWVGLSKPALLASAEAVNNRLESGAFDRWALVLPGFHVGGLGVRARSFLTGAKVFDFKAYSGAMKWNAGKFYEFLIQSQATLTSLVPSQLYDLIQLDLKSPPYLRALMIGGGHLLPDLLDRALENGWRVLPSYGLTECCSTVAMATHREPSVLKILPHIKINEVEGRLTFSGPSLLSSYAYFEEDRIKFVNPKTEGRFISMDRGEVNANCLSILGRVDDYIKIGGEHVDVSRLESFLQTLRMRLNIDRCMTLLAIPDERLGHIIHLIVEGPSDEEIELQILEAFHAAVLPFERIRVVKWIDKIPKSSLSKILRKDLLKLIIH